MQERMTEKQKIAYESLKSQIDNAFKHINCRSHITRKRYKAGMYSFARYLAVYYNKQIIKNINNKHIASYINYMHENECKLSYIRSNLAAIRFFYRYTLGGKIQIWDNHKLGVVFTNQK